MDSQRKEWTQMLNEKVKLNTCCIGIGFAGSYNTQQVYDKLEIPAFIINSSTKDLSNEIINKEIPSFIIGKDGRGAGNDRVNAREMLKANGRKLLEDNEVFVRMIAESDIVVVIFSTAGGTGSGAGPNVVKLLGTMYPGKIVIPVVIAPKSIDSPLSQFNNLECINEIDALNCPYVIGDLDRFCDLNDNEAYEKMSEWVVEVVRNISGMNLDLSDSGMMDENDLQTVISEDGYLAQYTVEVNAKLLEKCDIQDLLIKAITESPAMGIQKDHNISWGGLIVNLPQDVNDPIRTGNLSKITHIVGTPKHIYKNYSVSKSTKGSVTLILSGLSLPYNRLSESTTVVKDFMKSQEASKREISLNDDLAGLTKGAFGGFSAAREEIAVSANKGALDDFFGNN